MKKTGRDSERFVVFHTLVSNSCYYCKTFFRVAKGRAPQGFVDRQEMWQVVVHRAACSRQQDMPRIFNVYPFGNIILHDARCIGSISVQGSSKPISDVHNIIQSWLLGLR